MFNALTSVGLKCQRQLEKSIDQYTCSTTLKDAGEAIKTTKLKTMCQTRKSIPQWRLDNMYTVLCMCLEDIPSNNNGIWDGKAASEAQGLFHLISTPGFITAFKVNYHIFGY